MAILFEEIEKSLQFSGHETFPLRQLWLRKAFDAVEACGEPSAPRSVFADEDAIVRFGVGKNMVSSIRHWSLACDVIEEVNGAYRVTRLARMLFGQQGLDRYIESPATAWLCHWMLAGRGLRSTTWFWLFNFVLSQTFDRDALLTTLKSFARERQVRVSDLTLSRDIECCIRSYVPKVGVDTYEDVAEPVLGELGLIQETGRGSFAFRRGPKPSLPHGLFAFALVEFWDRYCPDMSTLSFEAIAHEFGSPGRVFKLDENSVIDYALSLENLTNGLMQWSDTAGLRQIIKQPAKLDKLNLLRKAYA